MQALHYERLIPPCAILNEVSAKSKGKKLPATRVFLWTIEWIKNVALASLEQSSTPMKYRRHPLERYSVLDSFDLT